MCCLQGELISQPRMRSSSPLFLTFALKVFWSIVSLFELEILACKELAERLDFIWAQISLGHQEHFLFLEEGVAKSVVDLVESA